MKEIKKITPLVKGLKGDKGEVGLRGARGIQGEQGPRGAQGLKGEQGERGEQGDSIIGPRGPKGTQGEVGKRGERGLRGYKGIQGRPGKDAPAISVRELSKQDQNFLKDLIGKKAVADLEIDEKAGSVEFTIKYTDGKFKKKSIEKGGGDTGVFYQREKGTPVIPDVLPEDTILYLASIAPSTGSYTGGKLTSFTYTDFQGITNHTKTLTYTGDELTSTQEVFDYDAVTWTVDITLTYLSGVWQTKNINISKV